VLPSRASVAEDVVYEDEERGRAETLVKIRNEIGACPVIWERSKVACCGGEGQRMGREGWKEDNAGMEAH